MPVFLFLIRHPLIHSLCYLKIYLEDFLRCYFLFFFFTYSAQPSCRRYYLLIGSFLLTPNTTPMFEWMRNDWSFRSLIDFPQFDLSSLIFFFFSEKEFHFSSRMPHEWLTNRNCPSMAKYRRKQLAVGYKKKKKESLMIGIKAKRISRFLSALKGTVKDNKFASHHKPIIRLLPRRLRWRRRSYLIQLKMSLNYWLPIKRR